MRSRGWGQRRTAQLYFKYADLYLKYPSSKCCITPGLPSGQRELRCRPLWCRGGELVLDLDQPSMCVLRRWR
jgi:hypothetical protein